MNIKVGTLFSGIGSVEWALKKENISHEIIFACDNGEVTVDDIDYEQELQKIRTMSLDEMKSHEKSIYSHSRRTNFVKRSYLQNYELKNDNFHYDIRLLDGFKYKDLDLLVGGSPCQSFSIMGEQMGLDDTRGTLFYEYARLVTEIKPKVFIYENVQGLLRHDKGKTWKVISKVFDDLGYTYKYKVLNSKDFGVPQNRSRIFVVGFLNEEFGKKFEFPNEVKLDRKMQDLLIENIAFGNFHDGDIKLVGGIVESKHYLSDKVLKHVMSTGTKNYYSKPETDLEIARPLLATMHKMHRAGVDNYVTIDGRVRRLTPRECLRLMGFDDTFVQVVSDTQMYRQAGNSIVVNIFAYLLNNIIETGVFK